MTKLAWQSINQAKWGMAMSKNMEKTLMARLAAAGPTGDVHLSLDEVEALAHLELTASGASDLQAAPVAQSIRAAEADGYQTIGLGYLPIYCSHLRCGKVDGKAEPRLLADGSALSAVVRVDAGLGFPHAAFAIFKGDLVERARALGVASMAISRSYSAGVLGWFVEQLAEAGLIGIGFANASSSVAPWGATKPFFGTNPMALAVPREGKAMVLIDQASSQVARVSIVQRAAKGEAIPSDWGFDHAGNPTTDPKAVLEGGSLAPFGGYKGYGIALMVDILAAGLTGANWSFQASSFGNDLGGPPNVGQMFLALDPAKFSAGSNFPQHLETMLSALEAEPGARLPGSRRAAAQAKARADGVTVSAALLQQNLDLTR
ncbi:MAG TPA: Ldh family oxidoreductase [Dongiaceae bacterium]